MRVLTIVIFVLFTLPFIAQADELMDDSILIGHNVTPTTDMLKSGVTTVGTYAMAYGFSDSFFIATSPWIWGSYNTANVRTLNGNPGGMRPGRGGLRLRIKMNHGLSKWVQVIRPSLQS